MPGVREMPKSQARCQKPTIERIRPIANINEPPHATALTRLALYLPIPTALRDHRLEPCPRTRKGGHDSAQRPMQLTTTAIVRGISTTEQSGPGQRAHPYTPLTHNPRRGRTPRHEKGRSGRDTGAPFLVRHASASRRSTPSTQATGHIARSIVTPHPHGHLGDRASGRRPLPFENLSPTKAPVSRPRRHRAPGTRSDTP